LFLTRLGKVFKLQNINSSQAKYLQLADTVRCAIRQGQLAAGDKLPSVKSISEDLGVNRHTVMKSLAELVAEGWIESTQRVGYKMVLNLPVEKSQSQSKNKRLSKVADNPGHMDYRYVRSGSPLPSYPANDFEYNFSGGQPDLTLFPFDEFKRCMSDVLSRPDPTQLSYGQSAGTPELIDQVKIYLRKSRAITDREIVITNGSQEALFIVAQLYCRQVIKSQLKSGVIPLPCQRLEARAQS
jgi:GntR family transcriptional regulator/MocR family aminotransferase